MKRENNATDLKPYSVKEIASIYNVCGKTLKKWLKPHEPLIGAKQGRFFTVAQVKLIFEKLGIPGTIQ
jgi:hypothetical protein